MLLHTLIFRLSIPKGSPMYNGSLYNLLVEKTNPDEPAKSVQEHINDVMTRHHHAFLYYATDLEKYKEFKCKKVWTTVY